LATHFITSFFYKQLAKRNGWIIPLKLVDLTVSEHKWPTMGISRYNQ